MAGAGEAASMAQGSGVPGAAATQVAPPPQHAPEEFNGGTAQSAMHDGSFDQETLTREQRFEAALSCREEGKGVKPRQGCASVQLNRECKEGTRTPEFVKFLEVVRHTADSEVLGSFGANPGSFDRADYMKVDRPLQFAGHVTDKYFNSELWQSLIPRGSEKGCYELRWLARHVIAQHATAAKRQMRCNQIPRKMLQKITMDHHHRQMQTADGGRAAVEPISHMNTQQDATNVPAFPPAGGEQLAGSRDNGPAPWVKDKLVIQTTVSRSRIESSLAAIQAQLRTGCVQGDVVHKTVQLTYALVFGTLGPMLQSIFNLSVLFQREFQLCQQVLCTIAGALTRLFGSPWHMSLASILAPGMREFSIRLTATKTKSFDRLEVAVCFVWAAFLQSAERNYISQPILDSWGSIPNGMWGEGRTDPVPGLQQREAAVALTVCSQACPDDATYSDDSGSGESEAVSYVQPPGHYSEEMQRENAARRTDVSQHGMSAQNMTMGMSASEGRQAWSDSAPLFVGRNPHQGGIAMRAAAGAPAATPSASQPRAAASVDEMRQGSTLPVPTALASPPYTAGAYGGNNGLPEYKRQRT